SQGLATNAILGFINMVKRLQKDRSPQYMAIAFDSKGNVFRHDLYPEYKANRPPMPEDLREQIPLIKEFVNSANLLLLEQPGVEADDIIATAVKNFTAKGKKVIVVSGDKDLLQLVNDDVVMFDPMKNKEYTPDDVQKKYGVSVDKLLDFFALVGDSADNVPGVPGVGPKTAEKLINSFESLDGIYQGLEEMKKSKLKEKIEANKDGAFLSRELIRLKNDVDIPTDSAEYSVADENEEKLKELYTRLEFNSLLKEIDCSRKIDADIFTIIHNTEGLSALKEKLDNAPLLVIDTETTSLNPRKAALVGVSLCTGLDKAYYIPVGHLNEDDLPVAGQLPVEELIDFLKPYLSDKKLLKIAHNLKYDLTVLGN
ncbi:MAG: DNA polymerase I, partial [Desulfobacterales bacterium]